MAITAGIYELRSLLKTSMTVTGSGYTPVTGSNVFLYSWNEGNNRKWRLTQGSNGRWRLQNAANGLYATLAASTPANGVNVRQWTSSSAAIQYWNVIDTGETVDFEGYTCPVVKLGSYATTDGTTWLMDVDRAMTSNNTNIQIYRLKTSGVENQEFVLFPTSLASNGFPVPTGLGWVRSTDSNPFGTMAGQNVTDMKIGFRCPDNWVPNASRTFERRVRKRGMDAATSTWGAWGQWEQWQDIDPFMRGSYCFDMNTLDASFDIATYKAIEYQVEVRAKTSTTHGASSASRIVRNIVDPTATLTSAGASAEGFLVDVTSDYAPAYYGIKSIDWDGTELLAREVTAEVLDVGAPVRLTIPWSRLLGLGSIPASGITATAGYTKSTDLFTNYSGGRTFPATLTLDYGEGPSVAPTVTPDEGLTLKVEHPLGIIGAWTSDGDGVYPSEDGSQVVYPFGRAFDLLVAVGDGTIWHQSMPAQSAKPCHAWNWDGGSLLLEAVAGRMVTSRTVKATADVLELDNRPWQVVTFAETLQGDLKAKGAIYDGSASGVADVMALMRAHHATYRAPSGEVMHVAVTDAQVERGATLTEVDLTMTQEAR